MMRTARVSMFFSVAIFALPVLAEDWPLQDVSGAHSGESNITDSALLKRLKELNGSASGADETNISAPSTTDDKEHTKPVVQAGGRVPEWAERMATPIQLIDHAPAASVDALKPTPEAKPFLDLDAEPSANAAVKNAEASTTDLAIRFMTGTVIVLGLCVVTILGIRKWQRSHGMLPMSEGDSKVLETVVIGPHRSVSLVQLRGLQAVVGCDASGIQSIVLAPPSFDDVMAETNEPDSLFSSSSVSSVDQRVK